MAKWTIQRETEKVIEEIKKSTMDTPLSHEETKNYLNEVIFDMADELEKLEKKKNQTPADRRIILVLSLALAQLDFKNYNNFKYPDLWFGTPHKKVIDSLIKNKHKTLNELTKDELIAKLAKAETENDLIKRSLDSLLNIKDVFKKQFWKHEIPYTMRSFEISKGKTKNQIQSKMQNKAREVLSEMEKRKPISIKDMINFKKKMRAGDKDLKNTTLERYLKNYIKYGDVIKPHHL